eukprot:4552988-Prorocentrum_lima.AAC.1
MQAYTKIIKTYGGTATKWAQRGVKAYAAKKNYTLCSMGISAAFLKGMTFKEIAKETGAALRSA